MPMKLPTSISRTGRHYLKTLSRNRRFWGKNRLKTILQKMRRTGTVSLLEPAYLSFNSIHYYSSPTASGGSKPFISFSGDAEEEAEDEEESATEDKVVDLFAEAAAAEEAAAKEEEEEAELEKYRQQLSGLLSG